MPDSVTNPSAAVPVNPASASSAPPQPGSRSARLVAVSRPSSRLPLDDSVPLPVSRTPLAASVRLRSTVPVSSRRAEAASVASPDSSRSACGNPKLRPCVRPVRSTSKAPDRRLALPVSRISPAPPSRRPARLENRARSLADSATVPLVRSPDDRPSIRRLALAA